MYRTVLMYVRAWGYLDQVSSLLSKSPVPPADAVATPALAGGCITRMPTVYTWNPERHGEALFVLCSTQLHTVRSIRWR